MDNIEYTINEQEVWMKIGRNLFLFVASTIGVQYFIEILVHSFWPELAKISSYPVIVSFIAIDLFALPIYLILMKRLPDSNKGEVKSIGFLKFIGLFSISIGIGLIGNILGLAVNSVFSILKGTSIINPVTDVIFKGKPYITILYVGIIAPIVEEIIFRKVLIDKVRRYGDMVAVLTSGIAFGLIHMNLHQFFYAAALGMIFAYVTIKTNTVKYAIGIHMLINLSSTLIGYLILNEKYIIIGVIVGIIYLLTITIGICLFLVNYKKIKFDVANVIILDMKKVIFNSWIISYIIICSLFIIFNILL